MLRSLSPHLPMIALLVAEVAVFVYGQTERVPLPLDYGAIPAVIAQAGAGLLAGHVGTASLGELARLATALFVHADAEHLLFNMVFLWAFGLLASRHLGPWWAIAAFFVTGICGNVLQVWLNARSSVPIVGASGAICGLEGIYLGLALKWHLPWPDVWPLAHPIPPLQLGAFALVGFAGNMYFLHGGGQNIAFGAHAGGFLAGLAVAAALTTFFPTLEAYEHRGRQR